MMTKLEKNKWRVNGEINHRLSVKEIARIQTFTDWFQFSAGGSLKLSKMVGWIKFTNK